MDESKKPELPELKSFDDILTHSIKLGKFQYLVLFILSWSAIAEGAEALVLSFLIPVLENEWKLSKNEQSFLGSSTFIGFFAGCLLSGQLADRWGRRRPLIFGCLIHFIFSFVSSFANNFETLTCLRLIYGLSVGVLSPISTTYIIEVSPIHFRGRMQVFIGIIWSVGALLACLIAYIFLDSFSSGNWRALLIWGSIPGFISFLLVFFLLDESPRFLLIFNKFEEAFQILEKAMRLNNKNGRQTLNEAEKEILHCWSQRQSRFMKENSSANPLELFKEGRCRVTILLWITWFILSTVYYGIMFILPTVLHKLRIPDQESINEFLEVSISVAFEIPSALVAFLIIEIQVLGRKNSLAIIFALSSLFSFVGFLVNPTYFFILVTITRFFINMAFIIIYPFTTEVYPTAIRITGLGIASAFSRIGGISTPWISIASMGITATGPFLIYGVLSLLAFLSCALIPFDTTGRELDFHEESIENEENISINKSE